MDRAAFLRLRPAPNREKHLSAITALISDVWPMSRWRALRSARDPHRDLCQRSRPASRTPVQGPGPEIRNASEVPAVTLDTCPRSRPQSCPKSGPDLDHLLGHVFQVPTVVSDTTPPGPRRCAHGPNRDLGCCASALLPEVPAMISDIRPRHGCDLKRMS